MDYIIVVDPLADPDRYLVVRLVDETSNVANYVMAYVDTVGKATTVRDRLNNG